VSNLPDWDLPEPFVLALTVPRESIDSFGHVNHTVYVSWLERCSWAHSTAVGFPESRCLEMQRGMAIRTLNLEFLSACYEGDELLVADWVVANDGRLRATRHFQVVNATRGEVALRADILYVCFDLKTGRPVRMPPEFREAYVATAPYGA